MPGEVEIKVRKMMKIKIKNLIGGFEMLDAAWHANGCKASSFSAAVYGLNIGEADGQDRHGIRAGVSEASLTSWA